MKLAVLASGFLVCTASLAHGRPGDAYACKSADFAAVYDRQSVSDDAVAPSGKNTFDLQSKGQTSLL